MGGSTYMKEVAKSCVQKAGDNFIEELFNEFIRPRLKKIKDKPKDCEIIFDIIEEYLKDAYERNKYMNTIVFNKETKTIQELYIPLTIVRNGKNSRDKLIIGEDIGNIFEKIHRVLIIDTAGMGKSTLAKYLYIKCLEKNFGIPFLIELRKLEKGKGLFKYICDELCLCKKELNPNDIRFIIERGEFIFFLDGYDEIPKEEKESISEDIRAFILEFSKNSFMLTSRDDESINMFSDFEKYHIRPLEKEEAYELIRKYDCEGSIGEELIREIENNDQYDVLEEFLENPLMVSLLYSSYHYKGIIQYKKHLFYRQVYDALYEGHDITKGSGLIHAKSSKLDVEDFNRLLSILGYLSIKQNKISFYRDEILDLIKKASELFGQEVKASDYLDDLLHSVPIFIKEGIEYKWSHKSFAEYYAAFFICFVEKEHEKQIIRSIMKSPNNANYHNVLDFCYDMDPKIAREVIIYDLASEYVKYCDSTVIDEEDKTDLLKRYYNFIDTIRFVKTKESIEKKEQNKHSYANAFCEAIDKMREETNDKFGFFNIVSKNYNVFMFVSRKPKYEIVKLLYEKNIDIFEEIREKEYGMKFWSEIDVGVHLWGREEFFHRNEKAVVSYIHHQNFSTANRILSYQKCLSLKREIEKDLEKEVDDIYNFN